MARQELAVQRLSSSGVVPTWSTPTVDGFKVSNDDFTHFHVKNGNVASLTITIDVVKTLDGLAVPDRTITIAAGAEKEFVLDPKIYNQPDSSVDYGKTYLDFSVQSSVSVKATHH